MEKLVDRTIAALRSGQFQQGKGRLIRKQGLDTMYCCLGVMTYVFDPEHTSLKVDDQGLGVCAILQHDVARRFKQEEEPDESFQDPFLQVPERMRSGTCISEYGEPASFLNDAADFTFEEIAECFEYTFRRKQWKAKQPAGVMD